MFIVNDTAGQSARVRKKHSVQTILSDDFDLSAGGKKSSSFFDECQTEYKLSSRNRNRGTRNKEFSAKRNPNNAPRIRINVRGTRYETYMGEFVDWELVFSFLH